MASFLWTLCLSVVFLASGTMSAAPRRPVDVPFGRNYVPTWAFDHITYFNGGNEIQLKLDKYTGCIVHVKWPVGGKVAPLRTQDSGLGSQHYNRLTNTNFKDFVHNR
ncbi:hypothetical protein CCACVL1_04204 [Corchorus capsularis]|uniref:Uncharacterized protein n=1 Tax=Corchorus capsularis TaxID=210143 RepID=A0A1R3JUQ5_COCAP|nr:hypothetical protein CCACVL1_04204 [Corchorus capsularis]